MGWICSRCEKTFEDRSVSCVDCGGPLVTDLRGQLVAGRYRLDRIIGTGSQESSVWKAWQVSFERPVALKLMPAEDDLARERFGRGARIASMLAHPHITTVHDYGEAEGGQVFLVMEHLEGRVLRAETRGGEPMPVERVVHIADQVLRALEDAHGHAVVHRDLKPDNLFLTHRSGDPDFVKVLDFGIAKYFSATDLEDTQETEEMKQELTHGWQLCGTPLYMAPEQIGGEAVDGRTDLYSLGVVMYQMLTGQVPFRAKTQYAVLSQHLRDPPPSFAESRPGLDVPADLEALVLKTLAKQPSERFTSAREMRKALADVRRAMGLDVEQSDQGIRHPSPSYPSVAGSRDQPAWVFPLLVVAAALFGAVVTHMVMDALTSSPVRGDVATRSAPGSAPSVAPTVAESVTPAAADVEVADGAAASADSAVAATGPAEQAVERADTVQEATPPVTERPSAAPERPRPSPSARPERRRKPRRAATPRATPKAQPSVAPKGGPSVAPKRGAATIKVLGQDGGAATKPKRKPRIEVLGD